jgi:hypothetical protein
MDEWRVERGQDSGVVVVLGFVVLGLVRGLVLGLAHRPTISCESGMDPRVFSAGFGGLPLSEEQLVPLSYGIRVVSQAWVVRMPFHR